MTKTIFTVPRSLGLSACIGVLFAAFVIVLSVFIQALVIQQLWAWFITPAFRLVPLAITTAIGFSLLVSAGSRYKSGDSAPDSENTVWRITLINLVYRPLAILAIGYCAKLFL